MSPDLRPKIVTGSLQETIKEKSKSERAIEILEEALSGQSAKSKNELIKDAIRVLK
jgi:hypothetical protein